MTLESKKRRVAVHEVVWPDGSRWHQVIVVLEKGTVVDCFKFVHEQPSTEWLGGTIFFRQENEGLSAWWNDQKLQ